MSDEIIDIEMEVIEEEDSYDSAENNNMTCFENKKKWVELFYSNRLSLTSLKKEFISCKPKKAVCHAFDNNSYKNRYPNIPCLDETRVKLKDYAAHQDYIHANWVTMPDGFRYICTQAPMGLMDGIDPKLWDTRLTEHFYHMVFMENVETIVMLCDFYEGIPLLRKCCRYLPRRHHRKIGDYSVYRQQEGKVIMDGIMESIYEVRKCSTGVRRNVTHYQVTNWKEYEHAQNHASILKLFRLLKGQKSNNPIVVHSAAGVGRAGSFVAIDYGYQSIGLNWKMDMLDVVKEIRKMRSHSIQSHYQYLFVIYCITELCIEDGVARSYHMARLAKYFTEKIEEENLKNEFLELLE